MRRGGFFFFFGAAWAGVDGEFGLFLKGSLGVGKRGGWGVGEMHKERVLGFFSIEKRKRGGGWGIRSLVRRIFLSDSFYEITRFLKSFSTFFFFSLSLSLLFKIALH